MGTTVSGLGHQTWSESLTSVNTLPALKARLVFGKPGLEIAGWVFFNFFFLSGGFKRGSAPWACSALRMHKGCSNVKSNPPTPLHPCPQTHCYTSRKRAQRVNVSAALRPRCVWRRVYLVLNMTLAINDIKPADTGNTVTLCKQNESEWVQVEIYWCLPCLRFVLKMCLKTTYTKK